MLSWGGSTTSYSYMEDGKGFQTKQDQLKIVPYNKEIKCQGAGIMEDSIDELTEPIHTFIWVPTKVTAQQFY